MEKEKAQLLKKSVKLMGAATLMATSFIPRDEAASHNQLNQIPIPPENNTISIEIKNVQENQDVFIEKTPDIPVEVELSPPEPTAPPTETSPPIPIDTPEPPRPTPTPKPASPPPTATKKPETKPVTPPATDSVEAKLTAATASRFGSSQAGSMVSLLTRESGLNPYAVNNQSGACGLPQALPCQKLLNQCGSLDNLDCQISWALNYVAERYSTPSDALLHLNNYGWY